METSKTYPLTLDLRIPDVSVLLHTRTTSVPVSQLFLNWSIRAETQELDGIKWLSLYLAAQNKSENQDWPWHCEVNYDMILKNQKGQPEKDLHRKINKEKFSNSSKLPTCTWGFNRFYKYADLLDDKNGFILDGGIHLQIKLRDPPTGIHFTQKMEIQSAFENSKTAVSTQLILHMLESGEGTNVVIVAKDKVEFKAHLGVLKKRSEVFAKMFEADMEEAKTGKIALKDIHSQALKALLRFIYTGDCSEMEELDLKGVKELINAGEKYQLPELKKYCGYLLVERCDFKNALKLHQIAKKFALDEIAKEIFSFAQENIKDVWGHLSDNVELESSESDDEEDQEEDDD